jgi:uncharacterized protein (DUF433 family)
MTLMETLVAKPPPVEVDKHGVLRVGGTRVTLDTVVEAHREGLTPEEISESYDVLTPAQVYAAIGYYLENKDLVEAYLEEARGQAVETRKLVESRNPRAGFKERLLARQREQTG